MSFYEPPHEPSDSSEPNNIPESFNTPSFNTPSGDESMGYPNPESFPNDASLFDLRGFFAKSKVIFGKTKVLRFEIDSANPIFLTSPPPFVLFVHKGYARAIVKADTMEQAAQIISYYLPVKKWLY